MTQLPIAAVQRFRELHQGHEFSTLPGVVLLRVGRKLENVVAAERAGVLATA